MRKLILSMLAVLAAASLSNAQDLGGTLGKVAQPYGEAYVAPAVNAFGMDLNSGLFHTAHVGGMLPFGLNLYVGVQVGNTLISSSDKTFDLTYRGQTKYTDPFGVTHTDSATFSVTGAPTIFGSKQAGTLKVTPDNPLYPQDSMSTIGGLVNTSIAPLPIPQLGLGSLFGTDVMVRWLPSIKISNYGKLQLFGWGLRHSVSQYIPLIPIDIAVQLGFQNFSIKDTAGNNVFKASTFAANLEVSKTFAIITLYGGLQLESSKVDINYTFTPSGQSPQSISFSLNGKNKFRALIGLNLGLGPLTINADYNLGSVNALNAGLGITI